MKPLIPIAILLQAVARLVAHPGSGIAVDAHGRVFFTAGPMIVTIETTVRRPGHRSRLVARRTFDEPKGIALAQNGDLFVLEPHRPRVRKISDGRVITIHQGLP
jgi:hypothetical protein